MTPAPMTPLPKPLKRSTIVIAAMTLILTWGSAFTMVGVAVDYLTPAWIVAYRLTIGAGVVSIYMFLRGHRFPPRHDIRWRWYFCMGLTGAALPFFFMALGQTRLDSGLSAIIAGAMPLMTVTLAHFFTQEKLTVFKLAGFIVGFCGLCLLFLPDPFTFNLVKNWTAQGCVLLGAFGYAVTTVIAKRAPQTPASMGAAMMLLCGACAGWVIALVEGLPDTAPPPIAFLMMAGLGIGSSGVATVLYLYLVEQSGPTLLAKINYFTPAVSVIFCMVLLGEPLTLRMVTAFCVIVVGVAIAQNSQKPSSS